MGSSNEEWLARRIPAAMAAMLLTGIALATLPQDDGEVLMHDASPASEAAARVTPNDHLLELLREHRRVAHGDRAPYSLLHFAQ